MAMTLDNQTKSLPHLAAVQVITMNIIFCLIFALTTAQNILAQVQLNNEPYIVRGYISINDFENFSTKFSAGNIRTVKFENCLGGNALAGFRFAEKIRKEKLTTIASGFVASSCAFAFLGGVVRKVDQNLGPVTLVFHGSYYPSNLETKGVKANQELLDIFEKYIDFRFSNTLQKIILNSKMIDEGAYFIITRNGNQIKSIGYYCDGRQPFSFSNCEMLPGVTMESQGFLKE